MDLRSNAALRMCRRGAVILAVWISVIVVLLGSRQLPSSAQATLSPGARLRERAIDLQYNLEYEEARDTFRKAIAAAPDDPAGYRQLAGLNWMALLFQRGAVLVDDYTGNVKQYVKRAPPPADVDAAFRADINRALSLAERAVRDRPEDPDAHFQLGACLGFAASYTATVEGKVLGGVRAARRAYEEHERVLELDPTRKDAGFIVGTYKYGVSTLPVHLRLLARLVGLGADRAGGLRLVEEAAAYPSNARPDALIALVVIYNREERYDDALRVIGQLRLEHPRNRLLWLEAGTTALRANRPAQARKELEAGLARLAADSRQRAFGEEARWRLSYGSSLLGLRAADQARREFEKALSANAMDWVHGRAHKELGKLADLAGDRPRALQEYGAAIGLCRKDDDTVCVDEATQLISVPFR